MNYQNFSKNVSRGFTLIELVVVIVVIGILAAVAIPKLTNTAVEARLAKQDATLGALKSSWTMAYARFKRAPTAAEILGQMAEPECGTLIGTGNTEASSVAAGAANTDGSFFCEGVTNSANNALMSFTYTVPAGVDPSPALIVFTSGVTR